MKKVIDELINKKIFKPHEIVAVAVSGGMDSIALLHLLHTYENKLNIKIICLNINHGLRGEESDKDSEFVLNFCNNLNIEYVSKKIDVLAYIKKHKMTTEQAARELRYESLYEIMKEKNATKLCLAHHKNDQAETILMHIFRGSGLNIIVRPFLFVSRKQIEDYIVKNNLKYVTDSSNLDVKYTRNYIRNEILPRIQKIYPKVFDNLSAFAESCKKDDEFIESCLPIDILKFTKEKVYISPEILNYHESIKTRLIRRAFLSLGTLVDIEEKHISMVLNLFSLQSGKTINLPHGFLAVKEYDSVILSKNNKKLTNFEIKFKKASVDLGDFGKIEVEKVNYLPKHFEKNIHYVDADKISDDAIIRTRKNGDIFCKFSSGTKSLNSYFKDNKISLSKRDNIPVLSNGNEILIVLGYEISEKVKVDKKTRKILKITYKNGIKND